MTAAHLQRLNKIKGKFSKSNDYKINVNSQKYYTDTVITPIQRQQES